MKINTDELLRALSRRSDEAFAQYKMSTENPRNLDSEGDVLALGKFVAFTECIKLIEELETS